MKMSICLSVRTYLVHPLGIVIRSQREMGLQQKKLLTITFFAGMNSKVYFTLKRAAALEWLRCVSITTASRKDVGSRVVIIAVALLCEQREKSTTVP